MMEQNKNCENCPIHNIDNLTKLGVEMQGFDFVVALAGNPNTGKSTIFNNLTGLKQHTGNWPGKTVTRAEGALRYKNKKFKLVDLPGTYSLLSTSTDEEVARNFILFGRPDVTIVVVDSTKLERNLNLVLQILEITDRVVVALNLIDEAKRKNIVIDSRRLSKELGVPVVETTARSKDGMNELTNYVHQVASGEYICRPRKVQKFNKKIESSIKNISEDLLKLYPNLPNSKWVAIRLLEGDQTIVDAIKSKEISSITTELTETNQQSKENFNINTADFEKIVDEHRWELGNDFHDHLVESIFNEAESIAKKVVRTDENRYSWEFTLDRIVTSRVLGFPIMFFMLAIVFWLTIIGSNVPSSMLAQLLVDTIHPWLKDLANSYSVPQFISGVFIDGAYLAMAWVISVMLPPMAIFFPVFTLLEDFGYLPRVAYNMDRLFQKAGAHGKQALTMSMGFGCNAAGVIATRVIDSPRERLIAIITNNFSLCNGRWPTQILIATIFIGTLAPPYLSGIVSAAAVVAVALLGVVLALVSSWGLSNTLLKGEASSFSLELPPYRPPRILQTIYTSLIDRTIFVLWRAIVFAIPAGMIIWLVGNVSVGEQTLGQYLINLFDPFALFIGLNGVILLAYIIAIPANEIVIPTILMLTVMSAKISGIGEGAGVMFELDSIEDTARILQAGGWTVLTGINLMLFSLIHNPCSTTIFTIYKETNSVKWTAFSALVPIFLGFLACFFVTQIWYLFS